MTFIDLRDRYGITQLVVDENTPAEVRAATAGLGREYVIQATGTVRERSSKNLKIPTGDIEVAVSALTVLNRSCLLYTSYVNMLALSDMLCI